LVADVSATITPVDASMVIVATPVVVVVVLAADA
jgi:hypothetical protein